MAGFSFDGLTQDLLVDSSGDSLNIQTQKIEHGYLYYTEPGTTEEQFYPVNRIKIYVPRFYKAPQAMFEEKVQPPTEEVEHVPDPELVVTESAVAKPRYLPAILRVGANVGWGHLLAQPDPLSSGKLQEHIAGLRNGIVFGASADLFPHRFFGLGVEYQFFNSSHDLEDFQLLDEESNIIGTVTLSDQLFIHSIGLRAMGRFHVLSNRLTLNPYLGANQIWYIDKQSYGGVTARLQSTTIGFNGGASLAYKIDESFGIGLDINTLIGALEDYTIGNSNTPTQSSGSFENGGNNVSRLNIILGLRWFI